VCQQQADHQVRLRGEMPQFDVCTVLCTLIGPSGLRLYCAVHLAISTKYVIARLFRLFLHRFLPSYSDF
jgi:hypothetical protein